MSKRAEQAALNAYPISTPPSYLDGHYLLRQEAYIKGYEQAEKDLALTWEDIKYIVQTFHRTICVTKNITSDEGYVKTLQIFNEQREKEWYTH